MRWGTLVVAMLVLVAAPAAHAGTVTLTTTQSCECDAGGGTQQDVYHLRWSGGPGEANTATVSWSARAFHVKDTTAAVTAGNGCSLAAPGEATCPAPADCAQVGLYGCDIEFDLILDGGDGDDTLGAGPLSAVISAAGAGSQGVRLELDGGAGDDTLNGSRYEDVLNGGAGTDTLRGGEGDDILAGDAGADVIDGGADDDWVSYTGRSEPVVVDLSSGAGGGIGEGDQLIALENVDAGAGDDVLIGNELPNVLWADAGADRVDARGGNDYVLGGAGPDELRGGTGNDLIYGDGMRGESGLAPPAPPASDLIDGGEGVDAASWAGTSERVVVDLSEPGPDGEPGAPDTLTRIENVEAGAGHDTLIGDDRPNVLDGGSARDTIKGKGGNDTLLAGDTSGAVDAGPGNDIIRSGSTRLSCGSGFDRVLVLDRKPLQRACEAKAFMSGAWDPIRGIALTALLELRNASGTMTLRSVSIRVRCPLPRCRGALRLGPQSPRITDGFRRINLKRGPWRTLRIPLNAIGRRRAARHNQQTMWLSLDLDSYAPVELKRAG